MKKHELVFGYRVDSKFVVRTGRIESNADLTFYLSAGAFVDDTIWVGNCLTATQNILNIASEFFGLMDISINTKKTIAIPINPRSSNISLKVSRSPILIAKAGETHWYLGIFLSTKGLSGPSLKKTNLDVKFFSSMVLRKAITDKQFFYLVSAVLQPIVKYRTQFSFVSRSTCEKWNCVIRKGFVKNSGLVKGASPAVESPLKLDILDMDHFSFVYSSLKDASLPVISVYINSSIKNFGTSDAVEGAATYFSDLGLHVGVEVHGLLSSTLAEMQAIALTELSLVALDFHNKCWVECHHIANLVKCKNISVVWVKVKGHSGVLSNEHADCLTDTATSSGLFLPANIKENFLLADGKVISGKAHHFIRIANNTVRHFQWEFRSGLSVVDSSWIGDINWFCTVLVWHPDSHMSAGYTSRTTASLHTYLMKTLHRRLPVAVRKHLYNRNYPSVSCICCGEVEFSDHSFTCHLDFLMCQGILCEHSSLWKSFTGATLSSSAVLQSLASSVSDSDLYTALCKNLVLDNWLTEAKTFFVDSKLAMLRLVEFIQSLQHGLLGADGSLCNIVQGFPARISGGVAYLLGVDRGHVVSFGLSSSHLFFTSAAGEVMVNIVV
ncbi:hypothetical protein G9A89_002449 [Geosiphon pyriformis]|nr:hypothetical protein G9A89_002449 [Geosiphon pyriformis]